MGVDAPTVNAGVGHPKTGEDGVGAPKADAGVGGPTCKPGGDQSKGDTGPCGKLKAGPSKWS